MANRRMFSNQVINSARFLQMPVSSRLLYYDLGMKADDEGFVEAFSVLRMTGASEDDLRILQSKGYIKIINDDMTAYICDWAINNQIRKDRSQKSIYHNLLQEINPIYGEEPSGNQTATTCQPSGNQTATTCQPSGNQTATTCQPSGNQTATTCQPSGNQTATTCQPSGNQTATTCQPSGNQTATTCQPSGNQTATTCQPSGNQTATSGCRSIGKYSKEKNSIVQLSIDKDKPPFPEVETSQPKIIPTLDEVIEYAESRGRVDLAEGFFDYYDEADWHDKNGTVVKNWKQKFISWELNTTKPQNHISKNQKIQKKEDDIKQIMEDRKRMEKFRKKLQEEAEKINESIGSV